MLRGRARGAGLRVVHGERPHRSLLRRRGLAHGQGVQQEGQGTVAGQVGRKEGDRRQGRELIPPTQGVHQLTVKLVK